MATSNTQVAEALATAGLPDAPFIQYIKAIGITSDKLLLSYCLTREEIDALIVRPLIQGFKTSTATLKADENDAKTRLFTASLRVIWYEATRQRSLEEAELNKNSQPSQPSSTATAAVVPNTNTSNNNPKSLPRAVWTSQIKKWEDKQGTSGRRFPQEQILGAESILARLWHEHNETKQYTALHLGELLHARSFTVTGDVNNLATKTKDANLKIVGGDLVQAEQPVLDPKSTWVIMDGLAAIKWAYIFCDYGTDEDVECYIEFFNKLARKLPSSPESVKNCWTASSWRVAMAMRAGRSFKVATAEVMADQHWVNQRLSSSYTREDRPHKSKGSGKGLSMSPTKGSPKKPSRGKVLKDRFEKSSPPCTWFQSNQCNRAKCRFPHRCDICGDEAHGSANCWHNKWQKQKKQSGVADPKPCAQSSHRSATHDAWDGRQSGFADLAPTSTGTTRETELTENVAAKRRKYDDQGDLSSTSSAQQGVCEGQRVVLLSLFDGIGTSALALKATGAVIVRHLAWEIDPVCVEITKKNHGDVEHRGDFTRDDPSLVAKILKKDLSNATLLASAAPPCPPWSRIDGGQDKGRESSEGKKFELAIKFISEIESQLETRARILIENVVFKDHSAVEPFEKMCGGKATVCDATDFGIIRRPRLWWTRADTSDENLRSMPQPFHKMKLGRYNEFCKIVPNVPFDTFKPDVIDGTQWFLPEAVESRSKRLPCLTTPALWADGRDEPTRKGKQASATAKRRWADDNRKYGPWAYETDAMLHDGKNNLRHVTANEAERLHHFPPGWTSVSNADERTRLRLVGNAWHAGVAKLMWIIVLLCPMLPAASTTSRAAPQQTLLPNLWEHDNASNEVDLCTPPLREQRETSDAWQSTLCRNPQLRPIERVISWFTSSGIRAGPWPTDRRMTAVYEQNDPMLHLQQAINAIHPDSTCRHLDPSIGFALAHQKLLRHWIIDYRSQVAADLDLLVEQMADETEAWKKTLQPHVLAAYSHKDAPNGITQIPVLLQLMEWLQLPDVEVWRKELTSGFKMMGKLTPGLGWKKRTDAYYANPISLEEFRHLNKANILKCIRRKPDNDSAAMLKEIIGEVDKGRMSGPYKSPPWWNAKTVAPNGRRLLPLPSSDVFVANAFAIHQIGSDDKSKVRRGEDWRRSFHNATVEVDDAPYHHNIESYAALATANLETWADEQNPVLKIWGQDHEGAYRQLPLENTREAFVHLMTDKGPTLWAHNVLLFGAVGSVWAYNRFGDIMCLLARILAWIPALHYVDDFGSIEREETADSAFDTFEHLNASLGLVMKKSKSQPPMQEHKMQGVIIRLDTKSMHPLAIVSTAPSRKARLLHTLHECLLHDRCSPSLAASLGGKLTFVSTSSFGRAGRAAVKAIYARQHAEHDHLTLNQGLRCSMKALCTLLTSEVPREISLTSGYKVKSIIYADAFFRLGDIKWKALDIPTSVLDYPDRLLQNGWGCVLVNESGTQFMEGQFPPHILRRFCTRKAFIYFLEIWAQILPMIVWWRQLDQYVLSFVDNEASRHALTKGYGNEPAVDNLIGAYWSMCSNKKKSPWFERVSSKDNISDEISRGDFSRATRLGWIRVFPRMNDIGVIMEKIADDIEYAFTAAANDLTELH